MKILKVVVACCVSALAASSAFSLDYSPEFLQAMTNGAKARIPLKVVDDDGISVSSVKVRVRMGMNFEERPYTNAAKQSRSKNGEAVSRPLVKD